jgi:hypothetical protein
MKVIKYLLGVVLIVYALSGPILGFVGTKDSATITNIEHKKASGGSSTASTTHTASYQFDPGDGKIQKGTYAYTTQYTSSSKYAIGDSIAIRYLPVLPLLNVAEDGTAPTWTTLILVVIGVLLFTPLTSIGRRSGKNTAK